MKPEQVQIHVPFLGGGFGRRGANDFVIEGVEVAKATKRPVKTVWSREDDLHAGYYRPLFLQRFKVGLDAEGKPAAWQQTIVGQSIGAGTVLEPLVTINGVDMSSVEGIIAAPYMLAAPARHFSQHLTKTSATVSAWRAVAPGINTFMLESMVDELAHAAGQDPVDYRRLLLKDQPRLLGVLNLAAEKVGWGKPPAGRAYGIAVANSFESFIAYAVEVSIENGAIKLHRVVSALDCGLAVNPLMVEAQVQSAVTFALSPALYSEITLRNGRPLQSNFHDFGVARMHQIPPIEVHLVPSAGKMGGIGEVGVPPLAPAIANAVFTLTGERLRELPLQPTARSTIATTHPSRQAAASERHPT